MSAAAIAAFAPAPSATRKDAAPCHVTADGAGPLAGLLPAKGDGVRIGANAFVAPGAILEPQTLVQRPARVDQSPQALPLLPDPR